MASMDYGLRDQRQEWIDNSALAHTPEILFLISRHEGWSMSSRWYNESFPSFVLNLDEQLPAGIIIFCQPHLSLRDNHVTIDCELPGALQSVYSYLLRVGCWKKSFDLVNRNPNCKTVAAASRMLSEAKNQQFL